MKKLLLILAFASLFIAPAHAQSKRPGDMTTSAPIVGSQIVWCPTGTTADFKCTFTQVAAYINSLVSGDCTASGTGTFTCSKTGGVAFGSLATQSAPTGLTQCLHASSSGVVTGTGADCGATIASGTAALGTSAIASAACATVVTATATGTATTDVVTASFNGDPTAVTGYVPLTTGMLTILVYPTSGNVNFKVCNNTAGSITPGAITLNWRVAR